MMDHPCDCSSDSDGGPEKAATYSGTREPPPTPTSKNTGGFFESDEDFLSPQTTDPKMEKGPSSFKYPATVSSEKNTGFNENGGEKLYATRYDDTPHAHFGMADAGGEISTSYQTPPTTETPTKIHEKNPVSLTHIQHLTPPSSAHTPDRPSPSPPSAPPYTTLPPVRTYRRQRTTSASSSASMGGSPRGEGGIERENAARHMVVEEEEEVAYGEGSGGVEADSAPAGGLLSVGNYVLLPPIVSLVLGEGDVLDFLVFLLSLAWVYVVVRKPDDLYTQAQAHLRLAKQTGAGGSDSSEIQQQQFAQLQQVERRTLVSTFLAPLLGGGVLLAMQKITCGSFMRHYNPLVFVLCALLRPIFRLFHDWEAEVEILGKRLHAQRQDLEDRVLRLQRLVDRLQTDRDSSQREIRRLTDQLETALAQQALAARPIESSHLPSHFATPRIGIPIHYDAYDPLARTHPFMDRVHLPSSPTIAKPPVIGPVEEAKPFHWSSSGGGQEKMTLWELIKPEWPRRKIAKILRWVVRKLYAWIVPQ